jgi:hypothetical protein
MGAEVPLIVRIPVKITFNFLVCKKNFLRWNLSEKEGGLMRAGPFFCSNTAVSGIPYKIRNDYFIIPCTDLKISITYLQNLEGIDS